MMKDGKCCSVHAAAWWLLVIGGINWGLVGAFHYNLVESLFGAWGWLVSLIYILVGLSAIALLFKKSCKMCQK